MDEPFVFSERREKFPHHVVIWQPHSKQFPSIGNMWMAEKADDPSYVAHGTVGMLVALAKDAHIPYVVVTIHDDGNCSVILSG